MKIFLIIIAVLMLSCATAHDWYYDCGYKDGKAHQDFNPERCISNSKPDEQTYQLIFKSYAAGYQDGNR
jgi:hypothetical protein